MSDIRAAEPWACAAVDRGATDGGVNTYPSQLGAPISLPLKIPFCYDIKNKGSYSMELQGQKSLDIIAAYPESPDCGVVWYLLVQACFSLRRYRRKTRTAED